MGLRCLMCLVVLLLGFVGPLQAKESADCDTKRGRVDAWEYWASRENYGVFPADGSRYYASDFRLLEGNIDPPRFDSDNDLYFTMENELSASTLTKQISLVRLEVDGRQVAAKTKNTRIYKLPVVALSAEAQQELQRGRNATLYLQTDNTSWKYKHEFSLEGYTKVRRLAEQFHQQLVDQCGVSYPDAFYGF